MGFRKHRRHRGGGGGGGGGGHYGYGTGEPNGLQPGDDVGNRRSFKPVQLPPEDIGNRRDPEEAEWVPEENVGNRIEASPTHEISGILADLDGRRRRGRRQKGMSPPERVGRYLVGGVNPLIANNVPRPFPGKTLEESLAGANGYDPYGHALPDDVPSQEGAPEAEPGSMGEDDRRGRRNRRGRGRDRDRDTVDGVAAQEVSERRASRFFDFEEDDRFEYTLKSDAEKKRKDAEDCVRNVVTEAGRDATVKAVLLDDGARPKILVTIDERGPAPHLPPERRAGNAAEPLFVMGNAALMSLNYLVNKIVNRYPDDRIRLAVLPAADEKLYTDALAEHRRTRPNGEAGRGLAPRLSEPPPPPLAEAAPEPEPAPQPEAAVAAEPEAAPERDEKPDEKPRGGRARRPRRSGAEPEVEAAPQKRPPRGRGRKAPEVEVVKLKPS